MLSAKDNAVAQAPVVYAQAKEFAEAQAEKLMELYAWFLSLTPIAQEKLQAALEVAKTFPDQGKELALAAPAQFEARFPTAVLKVKEAMAYYETQVSPRLMAQWNDLLKKVQEAKTFAQLEPRL